MNVKSKIDAVKVPEHWLEKDTQQPNEACKKRVQELCEVVYKLFGKEPNKICADIDSGIYAYYNIGDLSLSISVENDLDAAWLVNDEKNKKVLFVGNIEASKVEG